MTKVTGASDDLIEIEGELEEEFNAYNCDKGTIAFSDGTLLNVIYDNDGLWRFAPKFKGSLYDKIEQGSISDDTNDIVYFKTGLLWCVFSRDLQYCTK